MYLIQQGKDNDQTKFEIEQLARKNNVSVKFFKAGRSTGVTFANLKPNPIDDTQPTNEQDRAKIISLISILEKAFPQYHVSRDATTGEYQFIKPKDIPDGVNKSANAFIKDGVIYLVEGRVTADSTVEEFLHPLINTIQQHNGQLFY